ncbi:hypothetical protein GPECTOR_20g487 [Gonium pectorale]|uniref:Uncharacterized protein n=1 Tax=Gonium pectorale TaxID=33097 RepID=A0A150GJI6_GONPE|nr:hypothetical protein GPECTOR_20g487 [Gonium pectorale]|eukprot:KXZ49630.1 hypothetical protein GPECTOR_20g487 [Gonium pectorale]
MYAEEALATLTSLASPQRVKTLLKGHPELLCVPLETWLDFLTAYGVTRREFFRLLSTNPRLLTRGSLFNAGNVIAFLQGLGMTPRDVSATVIPRCSRLLMMDCASRLAPVVAFLSAELGLDRAGVRDLVVRCPAVLSQDAAADLAPRLELLRAAGFSGEDVRRLLRANASLLTGDLGLVLEQRLSFLTSQCGFSRPQALAVLRSCPEVLMLTLPNLSRKWRFLTERMRCGTQQVLDYPRFWAKSLLLEIGPRFAYVTDRRLLSRAAGTAGGAAAAAAGPSNPGSSGLDLRLLLDSDDVVFMERVWRGSAHAAVAGVPGRDSPVAPAGGAAGEAGQASPASLEAEVLDLAELGVQPDDYERYRSAWLETEGVRWSGVKAVVGAGAVGSW